MKRKQTAREGTQEPVKQEHSQQQAKKSSANSKLRSAQNSTRNARRGDRIAVATAMPSARNTWKQLEQERERELREGWSTRHHVEKRVEADDEVWEKNLNVSAQDKSKLTTITDEKESCLSPKLTRWCTRQRITRRG